MNIKEMHYTFMQKFNKTSASANRYLRIPEIDLLLNEAQMRLIKMVAFPEYGIKGFEFNQRSTDSIRTIVVSNMLLNFVNGDIDAQNAENIRLVMLPDNYLYYVRSYCYISNEVCNNVRARIHIQQHDDEFVNNVFYGSSIAWKQVNATFVGNYGINSGNMMKLFFNNFTINSVYLDYIRRPLYMHNAEDFNNGSYVDLNGNTLTGTQDSELPEIVHNDIVDLAVLLATIATQMPDIQAKLVAIRES